MSNKNVMGNPTAPNENGSTVKVKYYVGGVLENWFANKARSTENHVLQKVYITGAVICKTTREFFSRTYNKLKSIRITRPHLRFYGARMLVNLAFSAQGLIGLLSLGLFSPSFTARTTVILARATKDLQVFQAAKDIDNNKNLPKEEQKNVPKHLAERAERSKMTDDEILEEMDRILAEQEAKAKANS